VKLFATSIVLFALCSVAWAEHTPLSPVSLTWTIPPAPEPPYPGYPGWVPWRLDSLSARFSSSAYNEFRLHFYYWRGPVYGYVSYRQSPLVTLLPGQSDTYMREIPYDVSCAGERPCLLCLDYLCRDGRVDQRCAYVARPLEPPAPSPTFWQIGGGQVCVGSPDLFADGFEWGLRRWSGSKSDILP